MYIHLMAQLLPARSLVKIFFSLMQNLRIEVSKKALYYQKQRFWFVGWGD